ncbi:MAG: response regulator [Lachnospiraceae bacterium]|nr:response regulator [Lachnospiraceae bacterium]
MLRIIIVDDESITRLWIKKKIEELGTEYDVAGEFANGRQALEYCKNNPVDVIFTDIRMPHMDGIELLKSVGDLDIRPYKVILSAHDEFQYAREALKLGAREFLLKSEITKEEIRRILKEAARQLGKEEKEKAGGIHQDAVWRSLLEPRKEWTEEEIQRLTEENLLGIVSHHLAVISIWMEKEGAMDKVPEIFELYRQERQLKGGCFSNTPQELTIIYNHQNGMRMIEVAEDLYHILRVHLGGNLFIGISTKKDGFLKLRDLHRQALQARENRVFFAMPGCQVYNALQIEMDNELYFNRETKEIFCLVEEEQFEEADEKTGLLLKQLEQAVFLPAAYVNAICSEIITAYIHKVWKYTLKPEEAKKVRNIELLLGEKIDRFENLRIRVLDSQQYISSILTRESKIHRYSKPIQEIVNYVKLHYGEKIVMGDIAENIHLSRTYISVLFKKETGENFSEYLQRVRLENADSLLKNTRKSIQEIADEVGFFDSAHFNRAFKEYYKCSPIEYRKQNGNS